jgi:hypothetical protein
MPLRHLLMSKQTKVHNGRCPCSNAEALSMDTKLPSAVSFPHSYVTPPWIKRWQLVEAILTQLAEEVKITSTWKGIHLLFLLDIYRNHIQPLDIYAYFTLPLKSL